MRYVAFLRALNVGGRIVRMAELRSVFEIANLAGVETFLASGNVLFESNLDETEELHDIIEAQFKTTFGFGSEVFIRCGRQINAIAARNPFPDELAATSRTNCVGFTRSLLPAGALQALQSLGSDADHFDIDGGEIYWLSSNSQAEPSFTLKQLEKALGLKATFRGRNTVVRLAARCGSR